MNSVSHISTPGQPDLIASIKASVLAARRRVIKTSIQSTGQEVEFVLQMPGCFDIKCAVLRSRATHGALAASMHATRALFTAALTGWSGVRESHFGAQSNDPVPFQRDLLNELLDALPEVEAQALEQFDTYLEAELAKLDPSKAAPTTGTSSAAAAAAD